MADSCVPLRHAALASANKSDRMDLDINENDISDLSINDLSINNIPITSTPNVKRTRKITPATVNPTNLFKVPQAKKRPQKPPQKPPPKRKRKEKPKLVCNICGKEYVSLGYYRNHTRDHSIKASAERYPDKEKIMENMIIIVHSTLDSVLQSPPGGGVIECAQKFKESVGICKHFDSFCHKVCEVFCEGIASKKFLLPSKLLESLVKQCEVLTTDISQRSQLIELLVLSTSEHISSKEVLNFFYCEFVLCFSEALLRFIAQTLHGGGGPTTRKNPYECDAEDRQTIHYISGANMREFYKRCKRYPTSPVWKAVKNAIVYKIAANCDVESSLPEVEPCLPEDQSWTKIKDRGALIFVGETCLEFFVLLAEIIEDCEEPNGSISYMKVYEKVCKSMAATIYWDGMISDSLSEEISLLFLRAVVKAFCGTYGKGIRTRRMNMVRERPEASVNLRHSLAKKAR